MATLFDVDVRTVSEHLRNILQSGELQEESVIQKFRNTALQGRIVKKRNGSRVCFLLGGRKGISHTPHPETETDKGALEDLRDFLEKAGVRP